MYDDQSTRINTLRTTTVADIVLQGLLKTIEQSSLIKPKSYVTMTNSLFLQSTGTLTADARSVLPPASHDLACDEHRGPLTREATENLLRTAATSLCQSAERAHALAEDDTSRDSSSRSHHEKKFTVQRFMQCNRRVTEVEYHRNRHQDDVQPCRPIQLVINALVDVELLSEALAGLGNADNIESFHVLRANVTSIRNDLLRLTCAHHDNDRSRVTSFYSRQRHLVRECPDKLLRQNSYKLKKTAPAIMYHVLSLLSEVDYDAMHHYC